MIYHSINYDDPIVRQLLDSGFKIKMTEQYRPDVPLRQFWVESWHLGSKMCLRGFSKGNDSSPMAAIQDLARRSNGLIRVEATT